MEVGVALAFLCWYARTLGYGGEPGSVSSARRGISQSLKSGGIRLAVTGFLVLVGMQLFPFKPASLQHISPNTAAQYERTLPYYGSPGGVDFNKLDP